jgi:hypothetical protein
MLVLDYIISNEDRHYNNFGFVRNAETLEWLGLAPIYDSGTSLWLDTRFVGKKLECNPFKKDHEKQIMLVKDFSWFNATALTGLDEEMIEILSQSETIDKERRNALVTVVMERCNKIESMRK